MGGDKTQNDPSLVAAGSRLENMPFNYLHLYIRLQKGGGVKRQVGRKAGWAYITR